MLVNLIFIFWSKLILLFNRKLLIQSKQKILSNLISILQLVEVLTSSTKILQL